MKRTLVTLVVALTILVGFAVPAKAAGVPPGHCEQHLSYADCTSAGLRWMPETRALDRVRCTIPSSYRVVCLNYTPYAVRVRLNIFTSNGLYIRYFTMRYTRKVVYAPAYVNRVTWRWWWA